MNEPAQACPFEPSRTDYDLFSDEATDDPFPLFARIREEAPVFYSPAVKMWVVSRYDDIVAITRDTKRFRIGSGHDISGSVPAELADSAPEGLTEHPPDDGDPKGHVRWRRLANQVFSPNKIDARAAEVREVVDRLIDGFFQEGRIDLIARFAVPLPLVMIARILGIPETDAKRLQHWSDNSFSLANARMSGDGTAAVDLWREDIEYYRYVERVIEERRHAPREGDFLTDLIRAEEGATPAFTTRELVALVRILIPAGNETTRMLIGTMILRLLENPEQLAAVRANPALAGGAVEETLRYSGPAKGMLRMTAEEVKVGGVTIPKGQMIHVLYGSANRDAAKFEHPDKFDVHRATAGKHLGFGQGMHFCLGASLARLEARIALERILARLPGLRLASPDTRPRWNRSLLAYGLTRLDIEWDTRK